MHSVHRGNYNYVRRRMQTDIMLILKPLLRSSQESTRNLAASTCSTAQLVQHVICEVIKIGACCMRTVHAQTTDLIVSTFRMVVLCNKFRILLCRTPDNITCQKKSFLKGILPLQQLCCLKTMLSNLLSGIVVII